MERYKQLIQETYTEPQNEQIIGSFIFIEDGEQENPSEVTKNKKTVKKRDAVKTKDIRNFFVPVVVPVEENLVPIEENRPQEPNVVVIDD